MRDKSRDEPACAQELGEGHHCESNGDYAEIFGCQKPRQDDRCDERRAPLADETEDLPEKTFDGGTPETAQNL